MEPRITPAEAAMLMPAPAFDRLGPAERAEVLTAQARALRAQLILDAFRGAFQALARGFAAMQRRQRTEEELSRLSDRALADIGIARGNIAEIAARPFPQAANDLAGTRHAA